MAARTALFGGVFARGEAGAGDEAWLQAMLDTEAGLARALERAGLAPAGAGAAATSAARAGNLDIGELGREAALTGNPVPALARALAALTPEPGKAAVHRGATSQDIIDTAAMLLARDTLDGIGADLRAAADASARLASAHRDTVMAGRTLLQQAVPVTFGLVAAGWLVALDEARGAVARARGRLAVQFGGAAGTLSSLGADGPAVARLLAEELRLAVPVLPWHTDRSRVIEVTFGCGQAAAALGKIARDVTLLAQTEVREVREGEAGAGQEPGGQGTRRGGSSAMPHKQNPVAAVAVLGCARQIPGLTATLLACAEQEHQRAAGAWHAEWLPFADVLTLTGSAAAWGADLLGGLTVDPARMRANLDAAGGLPLAERVTGLLAPAMGRIGAHDLVARASAAAASGGLPLADALFADADARARLAGAGIARGEVEAALDPAGYLGAAGQFVDAALAAHAGRPAAE